MCPPHSPTRITKNSILKFAGAFHCRNTSRIRFWAFSYSIGEPCGRSNQLIMYFISSPPLAKRLADHNRPSLHPLGDRAWGDKPPLVDLSGILNWSEQCPQDGHCSP